MYLCIHADTDSHAHKHMAKSLLHIVSKRICQRKPYAIYSANNFTARTDRTTADTRITRQARSASSVFAPNAVS